MIHGEAGAGKTTTSLHTSIEKNKVVFFVNCDILDFYSLRRKGTNLFLEHIMRALNLLELFEDEKDRELLYSLSGATLAKTFEHSNEHILIFDGLDENRFYSDPSSEGLKRLSETLVDIHCPIILVTRTAHFEESLYSELGSLVEVNNSRGGSKVRRKARAIKLPVWSETHILQLLDKIFVDSGNKCLLSKQGLKRLHKFRNLFLDNSYKEFYGDLPLNPLFLQFILSDVVERDIHKVNRPILIYQWIRRKIFRDIKKENRSFPVNKKVPNNEILILVDKLLYLMELVSKSMTMACENGTFKINDFTDYREIQEAVAKTFGTGQVKAIDLLLNSALTSNVTLTRDKYRATKQKITFTFKIFQEYFLACYLVRNQECVALYPNNVKKFYEDIIKTEDENDLSFYLRNDFGSLEEKTSDLETENFGSFALPARVPVHIHTPKVTFMSEQIPDINISGGNFNGSTYFAPHHGDNIGTINNYLGKDEIEELNKFVAEVEAKYPNVQNEVEAEEIFNAEVVAVRDSDQTRWEILREQMSIIKRQLLNKERHFQATKATVVEVAKAAFEKSLMAKAVITYIDKLSEEPDRGS
ncbi:hypothetical protein [Oscillatoria sp. FACHB-1406]|uniref:hypothetical protein n=1 Tax=Oscillatoria sp. FACHB-1406 TaxID=2692846 RepID=UPI001685BAAE|nr:hypothetical protein [Oscillatoria sp. FACHB-1406]MBD2579512.1 hypothetical protein [Oscillatoria sp. FACHB-1406]